MISTTGPTRFSSQLHGNELPAQQHSRKSPPPKAQEHGESLANIILSQNYHRAHNPNYKTYAHIMNDAEHLKTLQPGEERQIFTDKPSPWLHINPNNYHHSPKPSSPLHPRSRV